MLNIALTRPVVSRLTQGLRFSASASSLNWYSDQAGVMKALNTQSHTSKSNMGFTLGDLLSKLCEQFPVGKVPLESPGITFQRVLQGNLKFPPKEADTILKHLARFQLVVYDASRPEECKITEAGRHANQRWTAENDDDSDDSPSDWMQSLGRVTVATAAAGIHAKEVYISANGVTASSAPKPVETLVEKPASEASDSPVKSMGMTVYKPQKLARDPRLEPFNGFVRDMSYQESRGAYGSVVGRESEIKALTDVMQGCLSQKVALHGPASSGKTAIVRGMAKNIHGSRVWSVDLSGVVAGTGHRGDMEKKFREFLEFVNTQQDIILHIPKAHNLINGGSNEDDLNLAAILSNYLEEPNMRMVLEMSEAGYRRVFAKDESLEAQFQSVPVKESSQAELLEIVTGLIPQLQEHYDLQPVSAETLTSLVRLTAENLRNKPLLPVMKQALDKAGLAARGGEMTQEHIGQALGGLLGIPLGRLSESGKESLKRLEDTLSKRVIGHDDAKTKIAEAIRRRRSGLFENKGPIGTFMLDGPTGVGKTELAKAVAEWLAGKEDSEDNLIRINFNEYGDKISNTRLNGAPPGYVGYEQGGQLTDQILKKPNSVILLDEIEKADPTTMNMILTLIDEGVTVDAKGRTIDARNCVFMMTTNAGASEREQFDKQNKDGGSFGFNRVSAEETRNKRREIMEEALEGSFTPEFRNRIDEILVLEDLTSEQQTQVINLHLDKLLKRLEKQKFFVDMDKESRQFLVDQQFAESRRKAGRKVKPSSNSIWRRRWPIISWITT